MCALAFKPSLIAHTRQLCAKHFTSILYFIFNGNVYPHLVQLSINYNIFISAFIKENIASSYHQAILILTLSSAGTIQQPVVIVMLDTFKQFEKDA